MTSLLIGCGNLGKIILEGFSKKKKKIHVLEKNIKVCKDIKTKFSDRYNFLFVILLSTLPEFFFRSSSILSFCILFLFISIGGMYFIRFTKNNQY